MFGEHAYQWYACSPQQAVGFYAFGERTYRKVERVQDDKSNAIDNFNFASSNLNVMKTIKSLLKELLRSHGTENAGETTAVESSKELTTKENDVKRDETGNLPSDGKPEQEESLTVKTNSDETENHEMAGVSDVADTAAAELPGNPEKTEKADREGETVSNGNPTDLRELSDHEETPAPSENALKKAYEEGYIAGRNSSIEEKYFPKDDDGIPHFHGSPSQNISGSDIFSMAREAGNY